MKIKFYPLFVVLALFSTLNSQISTASAQGTAFSYQGKLSVSGNPANGLYDVRFTVCDAVTNGNTIAGPLTNTATGVSNGLFAVTLDFGGGVFTGPARWLQLDVRTNGNSAFTTLSPREPVMPVPYAIMASSASNLLGTLPAAQLSGTLPAAQLPGSVLTNNGSGAGLTALNASQLTSGTLSDARLSGNVALLNGNQTFIGVNTFSNSGNNFTGKFSGNGAALNQLALNNITNFPAALIPYLNTSLLSTQAVYSAFDTQPVAIAVAEVNGDGKPDLIVASQNDGLLTVLTNKGTGAFAYKTFYSVGGNPRDVIAADVNGDGKMDLIVANVNNISVLTNTGGGTFASPVAYLAGNDFSSVFAGDINSDGKVDLIGANINAFTISVLTNNGNGTFAAQSSYLVGSYPYFVTATDINGDVKPDLIVGMQNGSISVFTNLGSGTFASATTYSTAGYDAEVVIPADVNGDGKTDLVVSVESGISVLINSGNGAFASAVTYNTVVPGWPYCVSAAVADVNRDGKPDVIALNFNNTGGVNGFVTVLINNGSGFFAAQGNYTVGDSAKFVTAADVSGDGKMDLITANTGNNTVSVLLGQSDPITSLAQGNGFGLTNLSASAISGGITTNILTSSSGGHTLYITNGIIMNVQ